MTATPTIALTQLTSTSLQVAVTGAAGAMHQVLYQTVRDASASDGGSRVGDGTVDITGLTANTLYLVSAYSYQEILDEDIKLLLHFDGADGSQVITDGSASAHSVTVGGAGQLDTAQKKFGTAAFYASESADTLTIADHADFAFGSGDFTIHGWVKLESACAPYLWRQYDDATHFLEFQCGAAMILFRVHNGTSLKNPLALAEPTYGESAVWHHLAVVRSGNSLLVAFDGTFGTPADVTGYAFPDLAADAAINYSGYGGVNRLIGWLDELCVIKGQALWTANFTPPIAAQAGDPGQLSVPTPVQAFTLIDANQGYNSRLEDSFAAQLAALTYGGEPVFKTAQAWKHQLKSFTESILGISPFAFVGYSPKPPEREGDYDLCQKLRFEILYGEESKEDGVARRGDATHLGGLLIRDLIIAALEDFHPGSTFDCDDFYLVDEVEYYDAPKKYIGGLIFEAKKL